MSFQLWCGIFIKIIIIIVIYWTSQLRKDFGRNVESNDIDFKVLSPKKKFLPRSIFQKPWCRFCDSLSCYKSPDSWPLQFWQKTGKKTCPVSSAGQKRKIILCLVVPGVIFAVIRGAFKENYNEGETVSCSWNGNGTWCMAPNQFSHICKPNAAT